MNQNFFMLSQKWLSAMADVDRRLRSHPPARIANFGYGVGWSSIGMAYAYPRVRVDGFDRNATAIDAAWANAHAWGLTDRLTFHVYDIEREWLNGRYDLVIALDCLEKMNHPVAALRTMHRLAGADGTVIVSARQMQEITPHMNSTIQSFLLTADALCQLAQTAGFSCVEQLRIDHLDYALYRLHQ